MRRMLAGTWLAVVLTSAPAGAQEAGIGDGTPSPGSAPVAATAGTLPPDDELPSSSQQFVQLGVALASLTMAEGGGICPPNAVTPCILGSGAGLTVRAGHRGRGAWYWGAAYDASRHDSSNLLRLPILQQLRGEARYYLSRAHRTTPFVLGSLGLAGYGNEWGLETGGVTLRLGVGLEMELTEETVVGATVSYGALGLAAWTDGAGMRRGGDGLGIAHLLVLELAIEPRWALTRW